MGINSDLLTTQGVTRCAWDPKDKLMIQYHDEEWGKPEYDSPKLFAKLILDGFQAGLSWRTILYRRPGFYRAFQGLDPHLMAQFTPEDETRLLADPGIIRNRLKVQGAIRSARAFVAYEEAHGEGSFGKFLWDFVDGNPRINHPRSWAETATRSLESDAMSKALVKLGFKFVGTTICYAFMQAVGMVDDHIEGCFCKTKTSGDLIHG